jgi:hypothetical protein
MAKHTALYDGQQVLQSLAAAATAAGGPLRYSLKEYIQLAQRSPNTVLSIWKHAVSGEALDLNNKDVKLALAGLRGMWIELTLMAADEKLTTLSTSAQDSTP